MGSKWMYAPRPLPSPRLRTGVDRQQMVFTSVQGHVMEIQLEDQFKPFVRSPRPGRSLTRSQNSGPPPRLFDCGVEKVVKEGALRRLLWPRSSM